MTTTTETKKQYPTGCIFQIESQGFKGGWYVYGTFKDYDLAMDCYTNVCKRFKGKLLRIRAYVINKPGHPKIPDYIVIEKINEKP